MNNLRTLRKQIRKENLVSNNSPYVLCAASWIGVRYQSTTRILGNCDDAASRSRNNYLAGCCFVVCSQPKVVWVASGVKDNILDRPFSQNWRHLSLVTYRADNRK